MGIMPVPSVVEAVSLIPGMRFNKSLLRGVLILISLLQATETCVYLITTTLMLQLQVELCVQVHKCINGPSPCCTSDLLVLNLDINDGNNRSSSLHSVCPWFKRETEWGAGWGTYFWCEANKIVKCSVKFFKDD